MHLHLFGAHDGGHERQHAAIAGAARVFDHAHHGWLAGQGQVGEAAALAVHDGDAGRHHLGHAQAVPGQKEDLAGVAELAGPLAIAADAAQELAAGAEDADLVELGVQQVAVTRRVDEDLRDVAEELLVGGVLVGAQVPELLRAHTAFAARGRTWIENMLGAVDHLDVAPPGGGGAEGRQEQQNGDQQGKACSRQGHGHSPG